VSPRGARKPPGSVICRHATSLSAVGMLKYQGVYPCSSRTRTGCRGLETRNAMDLMNVQMKVKMKVINVMNIIHVMNFINPIYVMKIMKVMVAQMTRVGTVHKKRFI
jgi:hypothetical protein